MWDGKTEGTGVLPPYIADEDENLLNIKSRLSKLPVVDYEALQRRLIHVAPLQAPRNPNALVFKRPTRTQVRKAQIPTGPKLEPLV